MAGEISSTTATRATLLARVRNLNDKAAWEQFAAIYEPLIRRYLRRRGIQDADAADVAQDTMRKVTEAIGKLEYDRGKGRFRGWLLTIAHRNLIDHVARTRRAVAGSGDDAVHDMIDSTPQVGDQHEWERECQQATVQWAMDQIKTEFAPKTWQAFYATAVETRAVADVARELNMSSGAVYIARSRVTSRLRIVVEEVEDDG
jgi:RNA polymerase sigma-70 factor (ECF subfamily)